MRLDSDLAAYLMDIEPKQQVFSVTSLTVHLCPVSCCSNLQNVLNLIASNYGLPALKTKGKYSLGRWYSFHYLPTDEESKVNG